MKSNDPGKSARNLLTKYENFFILLVESFIYIPIHYTYSQNIKYIKNIDGNIDRF